MKLRTQQNQAVWDLAERLPDTKELNGTYKVKMFRWFRNEKIIGGGRGHNIAYGLIRWGGFEVVVIRGEMCFRYDNGRIVDQVRKIQDGVYIGKLFWGDKLRRWFRLVRT